MSSYAIVVNDNSSNFGVTVLRGDLNSEIPAADTQSHLVIPWIDNENGGNTVWNVSGATNAAPIVVTFDSSAVANPVAAADYVVVQSVGGNTAANGTYQVSAVGGSAAAWTATLKGSDGNAAYTSGGKIYKIDRSKLIMSAIEAAKRAIANDRAAGN
jgi:hypothetical protein